jgi:hypothetical protein
MGKKADTVFQDRPAPANTVPSRSSTHVHGSIAFPPPFFSTRKQIKSARRRSKGLVIWPGILLTAALLALPAGPALASMQFVEANYGGPILDDVTGLTVSPDGQNLYATGYWNGVIAVYGRNSATGRLTFMEVHKEGGVVDGL